MRIVLWGWLLWFASLMLFYGSICGSYLIYHWIVWRTTLPEYLAVALLSFCATIAFVAVAVAGNMAADWLLYRLGKITRASRIQFAQRRSAPVLVCGIITIGLAVIVWTGFFVGESRTLEKMAVVSLFSMQILTVIWSSAAGILQALRPDGRTAAVVGVAVGGGIIFPVLGALAAVGVIWSLWPFFQ